MKTAVSIPDDVFEHAELLARRKRVSRSELEALRALLADDASITDEESASSLVTVAARETLANSTW